MAITSKPIKQPAQPRTGAIFIVRQWRSPVDWLRTALRRLALSGACVLGFILAGYLWFFGAGWTVSGAPLLANILLAHVSRIGRIEPVLQVALPLAWSVFLTLWAFPVIFSLTELFCVPLQKIGRRWVWLGFGLAIVWLFVVSADLSSTFLGLYNPTEPASSLGWLLRGNLAGAAVSTVFFTFFPEWLVRALVAALARIWLGGAYAGADNVGRGRRNRAVDPAGDHRDRDHADRDSARD